MKDDSGRDYIINDLKNFILHIENFHSHGKSIHEENGFYFTVDDKFRKLIYSLNE